MALINVAEISFLFDPHSLFSQTAEQHIRIYEIEKSVFTRTWLRYVRVFSIANSSVCRL